MPARLRPPAPEDASAVLEVILARDVADIGVPDFTLEDLRADWSRPGLDLRDDARVALADGRVDGYAILLDDDALVSVHPRAERRGTGTVLRRWAEARAAERGTQVVRQFAFGANEPARRLLREAGYAPAQHYFRLRADLAATPPAPSAAGLRTFAPGDEEAVHALAQAALGEIDGYQPVPLDVWRSRGPAKEGFDPALWLVLEDAKGLAGIALGQRWPPSTGYVDELGVAARARGRGYGRTLLLALLGAFRAAGLEHAELSVHGRNRGALRLYEGVGMRPVSQSERWEKPIGRA